MTVEAEKSHNLKSASWRPRKVDGVVLVQSQMPENQGRQWCKSSLSPKEWSYLRVEDASPSSSEESNFSLLLHVCSLWSSTDWRIPIQVSEDGSSLLSLPTQMLISFRNTLTDKLRNTVYKVSEFP